jgi:DNA-binding transcriptional ArsR family regulator
VDELGCSTLEHTLHISKPAISYHTKILVQAGLLVARKEGRNFYYALRRDVLRALGEDTWALAPEANPVSASVTKLTEPTNLTEASEPSNRAPDSEPDRDLDFADAPLTW